MESMLKRQRAANMRVVTMCAALLLSMTVLAEAASVHSYWPAMGTYKGGSNLTVLLESPLKGQSRMFLYCRFDSIIVFSADYDPRAPEGPTITFVVPPFIEGKKEVELAFSADGLTFEPFGKFVYHEPVMIFAVEPFAGPPKGGHKVSIRLLNPSPFPESVTAADVRILAEPKCLFRDVAVPGTYEPASEGHPWLSVSCTTPPRDLGTVNLSVSLNGQEFPILPGTYTYTADSMHTPEEGADVEPAYITTETTEATTSFYYHAEQTTAQDPALSSACIVSIYPAIGLGTSSTPVSVSLGAQLPVTAAKRPLCRFGTNVTSGYYNVGSKIGLGNGTFVYCPAPTMPLGGTVPLSISLDGTTFTTGGASFTYYTAPNPFNVSNIPSTMNQLGPFEAVIQLAASPFPSAFTSFDQVASSAWCYLDGVQTPAAYFPPDASYPFPSVRCFLNATTWGQKQILFSFDGSYNFRVPAVVSFVQPAANASAPVPVPSPDVGVPLFGLGNVLSLGPPLKRPTPLPADAACLKYTADPTASNANLSSVGLDQGVSLSPPFATNITTYTVVGNDPKAVWFSFSLTPAAPGANVSVDLLSPVSVSGSPVVTGYFRAPLIPGTNIFTVRSTAPNGFTQNTYSIYVACSAAAVLTSLTADAAPLTPPFADGVYSYTLSVDPSVQQLVVTAATHGTRYTLAYAAAVYDPAQPSVVYPSIAAPIVGIAAVSGVPSNLMCRNYTTAANASKPLLPGGLNVSITKLPPAYGFSANSAGAPIATLAPDCVGTKVFYVWVTQTDRTAVVYTLTVKRGMPADLTPALSILDVTSGGTHPSPLYNSTNPPDTVYSVVATSIYQQLVLSAQPAAPVAAIRTVPDQVTLKYGHNSFSLALTGLDHVSKASYAVDAFVPSAVLAQIYVQYLSSSVFLMPSFPGVPLVVSPSYALQTMALSPQFQGTGPFNYSVAGLSQSYVLLTAWEWDIAAKTNLTCLSGCSGPLYVTDQSWLTRVSSTISVPVASTLNSTQWAQRLNVWALGLAYGVNQVQVNVTGSMGDSNSYSVTITRPSALADDATLTLVNISAPNGTQASASAQFSPLTQAYNVSLPKPVTSLLFSILTKNPAATVSMTVDSVPVAPSQISASYSPPAPTAQTLTNNLSPLPSQTVPPATYWQWGLPFGNVTAGAVKRVDFTVTSGSAQAVYTYWLSVALANDASLSGVGLFYTDGTQVSIPLSYFQLNGNQQMYTASMPKAVQVVGLYAIPTNPSSSIALNTSAPAANVSSRPVLSAPGSWVSPAGFSLGPVKTDSLFSLGVTAPDGVSKKVYLLDVVRLAGNDASLRSLNATVNGTVIQLDLRADPVQVPGLTAGATSARFSWAATDAAAASAYSLDGTTVLSGSAVTLSLSPGANSFKVRVTSEDGATTKWYTVNAVVPVTAGATLANMSTDPGLLVPAFSPSVAQYSVRLPSNVAVFVLYASAADPTVKISFTGTGQPSLNFPGEMRFKPDVGAVVLGVNPSASGPAGKYTLTVTALKDYEMLPYLDFTGSQSGMGYQTPLSSSSSPFPDSGGLRTTAGQPVQFQVATNCSRYQRDFGGDLTLCGGLGSLVVQLILGPPGFRGAASLVTNATCTIANGTLSYTPVAAGTYTVQAGLATCQQIAGYCDPAKYNTLSLQQALMVLPASDISPQTSVMKLPDVVLDISNTVHATFTPKDAYGNMQTSAHISCVVCPPTDAAPQNSSFCPAVNLTATTQLYATGAYDLTYVTSLAGIYQVVVYDYQGNRIMDGLQRIFLPRSAPIDGEQSSLLVPPGGLSVGQPNNVISVTLVPRDKAGNLIQFMDDSASIAGTLSPALGTGSGGQSVFSITSGNSTATANFTMFVTVSGLRPGGTYQLQIYAHDVPVKPALSVTLPPAISDRSVTSSGPPQSVLANAAFSYHLLPIAATSQKIGFGGEASFIQVGICAANASSAAVAGSAAADLAPVPPPACPTLMIASAQVTDSPYGDYTIKLTAPPQAGTYQITTIVSGNPLKESPKTVTVVLAGGSSGGTLSPAPTQTSVPVPAPAPGPSGSVPLIVPGLGSIQLLTQDQTQNGASVSFRVRDATGKPYTMLAFLAVVAPAADVVTAALDPVTFRSVPSASAGEYSVSVALTSSGRYSLLLYKCALATCVDVMPASTRGSGSVTPDMTLALAVPTGPLSPQTTTVNASTSFALNAVGSFIVTARDSNGLVSSQERDTARFAVTADHGVTGASFVDRYDGTYVCQFTPTETARYAFKVYIDQAPFAFFQADVIANSGDAAKIFVQGGVSGTVGQPVAFAVGPTTSDYKAVNSFALTYNPVVTALTLPPDFPSPFVSSNCANTTRSSPGCTFSFQPTIAGQYDVSVSLGPNQVSKSPVRVTVSPGSPSANLSVVTAPPGPVSVGSNCTFTVSLVDAFGNPTLGSILSANLFPVGGSTGRGQFVFAANEPNPSPLSFLPLSGYASQYTVTAIGVAPRGDYYLRVTFRSATSGVSMPQAASINSPVFTVAAGVPDARKIAAGLQGSAIQDSTAGDNLTLVASVFDSYNNVLTQSDIPGASVTLTVSQGGKTAASQALTWTGSRLQATPFVLPVAGAYQVVIGLGLSGGNVTNIYSTSVVVRAGAYAVGMTQVSALTNLTAGTTGTFQVQLRDAFGNPTSTDAGTDTLFANSCLQRTGPGWPCYWVSSVQGSIVPGQYTISYMLTWVAQYSVTLYVKSVAVPNVPGYVTVSPGDAVVATVSGAGASTGTVGESRSFFVVVLDGCKNIRTGGNATLDQLSVRITITTGKVIKIVQNVPYQGPTFDPAFNRYVVTYSATAVGLLTIDIQIAGTSVQTQAFPIAGGPTSAALSQLGGSGLSGSVAGVSSNVTITAVDQLGFFKTTGGDPFSVRLLDTSCPPDQCSAYVSDNADGTYALRYKFAQAGTYRMDVTLSGQAVGSGTNVSSPVTVTILSASASRPIDLSKTSVSGDGLAGAVAGTMASFVVTTYDSSGIRLFQGGAVFKLQMTPSASNRVQSAPKIAITDNKDGTYTVSYNTAGAGTYVMSLFGGTTGNTPTPALSGATATVLPGPTVAAKTTVAPFSPKSIVAGETLVQALISPMDAFGNLVTYNGNYPATTDQFIVQAIPGPNSLGDPKNFTVTTVVNQTYLATVNVTSGVGTFQLTVLLAGNPIATGAFSLAIAAGRSVDPWVHGEGTIGQWTAGIGRELYVSPFDFFFNEIDAYKPGCTCTGYLTSAMAPTVVSKCAISDTTYVLWDENEMPFGDLYMQPPIKVAATYVLTVNITQTAYPGYVNTYTHPDLIVVNPGDPSAPFTKAFGPGVSSTGGQAGQNTSFTIAVKDAYNNSVPNPTGVTYKITNPTGGLVYGTLVDNKDSTLTATYMPLATGTHKVTVSVNNAAVGNAFQVTITPPLTSAAKTTALLSGIGAPLTGDTQYAIIAGKDTKLVVTAYDIYGKKQLAKSDTFTATMTPATAADGAATGAKCSQAVNNNDGTYTITFSANKAVASNAFVVYSLAVTLNTGDGGPAPIAGSPFQFTVTAASVDAASSSVLPVNTAETATGLAYNFLLMTQDAFGNRGSYAPGSFYNVTGTAMTNSVVQSGGGARRRLLQAATSSTAGSGPQFSVVNNYDGTYGITLTTTQAIPYNITIRVNGVPVKSNQPGGVTFKNLVVASGRSTKSAFTASGNGIGAATLKAGDTAQITIQARDQYGNPTVDDLTSLAASLTSSFQVRVGSSTSFTTFSDASSVTVFPPVTQNPGMIVIPFTVFKAGTLVTTLGFTDGTVLRGSPYSGTIVPGAPSAASSLASGPGLKGALACLPGAKCVPASIYLTPQDANSNPFMGAATAATARAAMCARFAVVFSVPASIIKQAPQPDANDTSRCVVTYTASAPGDQTVQVGFDSNYVVGGGQFAMTVQSGWGAADAGQSTVSGDGINSVIVAGQSYKLTVMLSDANGLTLPSSAGTNVTASANSSALVFPFVDAQNGQMTASFTPVLSGVFVVTVSVNGKVIGGYPGGFRMKVVSAATSATTSRVALLNQTLFQRVPDPFTIQIFPRDAYGNPQDYLVSGPDAFSVALTLPDQSSTTLTPTPAQCNGIKCFAASFAPSLVGNYQVKTVLNLASGNMAVGGAANIILVPVFAGVPVLAKTEFRGQGATTAPAGTPTWFQFILKDAGGNAIDSTSVSDANMPTVVLTSTVNSSLASNATVWRTASWFAAQFSTVQSSYMDFSIQGQQFRYTGLTVTPGNVQTTKCYAIGAGVGTAAAPASVAAGSQAVFSIYPRDAYQNPSQDGNLMFDARITLTTRSPPPTRSGANWYPTPTGQYVTSVTPDSVTFVGDHYDVAYTPQAAGNYSVSVLRSNVPIGGGPYSVSVLPGPASAAASQLSPAFTATCVSGGTRVITVLAYDALGNPATATTDLFSVSVTGAESLTGQPVAMTSAGPGVYSYNYPCNRAFVQKSFLTVTLGSAPVVSEVPLTTYPGSVKLTNIMARAWLPVTVGVPVALTFVANDKNANQLWMGGLNITAQWVNGLVSTALNVTDNDDGTYQVNLFATVAGTYQLTASLSGQQFFPTTGTRAINVAPAGPVPQMTRVTFPPALAAGSAGTFTVQLLDQFANPVVSTSLVNSSFLQLTSVSSASSLSSPLVPSISQDNTTGLYTVGLTPLAAGLVRLTLTVNGVSVVNATTGQPYWVPVVPGAVSASNCLVAGAGFTVGAASGVQASFSITTRDANNNTVAALPDGKSFSVAFSDGTISGTLSSAGNGVFLATYMPTQAQVTVKPSLTITVTYDGLTVATSAVALSTQAGPVAIASSRAVDENGLLLRSAVKGTVGTDIVFFIQPSDSTGLDIRSNGAPKVFQVAISNFGVMIPVPLSDGTGRYLVNFTSPVAGQLSVTLASFSDSSVQLANSPVTVQVAPGPSVASAAQLLKPGGVDQFSSTEQRTAGKEDVIVVKSYDVSGNAQVYNAVAGGDVYKAVLTGPATVQASLVDKQDGTYELHYTATVAGVYNLTVSLRDPASGAWSPVNGQPMQITVVNANFLISQCTVRPAPPPSMTVVSGEPFTFTVVARDAYGNAYTNGDKSFFIFSYGGSNPPQCSIAATPVSSEFLGTCTGGTVGSYRVRVADGSASTAVVPGTPMLVVVTPGQVSGNTSSAFGDGLTVGTAGQVASFVVTLRDAANNIVSVLPAVSFSPPKAVDSNSVRIVFTNCAADGTNCLAAVSYKPLVFGNLTITVGYWTAAVGRYTPLIAPAPAPQLLSAKFSNLMTTLSVQFDQPTNLGGLQSVKTRNQTCQRLLDPSTIAKLGQAGRFFCDWPDSDSLQITLGYNATILPVGSPAPDSIILLPNVIGNAASNSYNASGSVPLGPPDVAPVPVVSLAAPSTIGPCDPVTLSAAGSTGGGGRPLTYSYFVQGPNTDATAALTKTLANYTADGSYTSITLGPTDLVPGTAYTFTVSATNFLGVSGTPVAVAITKADKQIPYVITPGNGPEKRITGSRNYIFMPFASGGVPGRFAYVNGQCVPFKYNLPMNYTWQQMTGPIINVSSLATNYQNSFRASALQIPGSVFQIGVDYEFMVSAALSAGKTLGPAATARVTLSLEPQSLAVYIIGGDRLANYNANLTVIASATDPDNTVDGFGKPYPFQFVWACDKRLSGAAAAALYQSDATNNYGQFLVFPPKSLPSSNDSYTFTVTVSKEPLSTGRLRTPASAKITMATSRTVAMAINVTGSSITGGVPSSRNLVFTAWSEFPLLFYSWTFAQTATGQTFPVTVAADTRSMAIPPGTLAGGRTYRVTLTVADPTGFYSGQTTKDFTVYNVPSGGTLAVDRVDVIPSKFNPSFTYYWRLTAKDWVKSPEAPNGMLQYQFRYSMNGGTESIVSNTGASTIATVNPWGPATYHFFVYVINPGAPASAPGDQPNGARYEGPSKLIFSRRRALLSLEEEGSPEQLFDGRSLLSFDEDESPGHFFEGRSLLQSDPVNTTVAIADYEDTFLPAAYQTGDYFAVLTWAIRWGATCAPPDPLALGCGVGDEQMRAAKADVLKMIDVLDQSAPPAFSPGLDSGAGATLANQHACALASILTVADEVALTLLPATGDNSSLSSTVAETQPAIQSAILTFLPKLQLIAQYGLATSPCAGDSGSCDNYACFARAADALLNAAARHCAVSALPQPWWFDAAAFVPVLLARVYGNDPSVSTPGVPTTFAGMTFQGTEIQVAGDGGAVAATAGSFGFSVPVSETGVSAYAIAYADGVSFANALGPIEGVVSTAALFLVDGNGTYTAGAPATITYANLPALATGLGYAIDVYQATGCDLWAFPADPTSNDYTTCVWSAAATNISVSVNSAATGTGTVAAWNGIFVLHTMPVPNLVILATATVARPDPKTAPSITVIIPGTTAVAVSVSVVGATPAGASATDPLTGVAVSYRGASPPTPATILPVAVVAVFFTQGAAAGAFSPFAGNVSFEGIPPPPAGEAYVYDVYHVSGCAAAMPPSASENAYAGCVWTSVAQRGPVSYDAQAASAHIAPTQSQWNGVFVLYPVAADAVRPVPAPPPPVITDALTVDPAANPVVTRAVGDSLTFSFAAAGAAPIQATAASFPTVDQVPISYDLRPAAPVVGAVALFLTQGGSAFAPPSGEIAFGNVPALVPATRRALLSASVQYVVDVYTPTGCTPAGPPTDFAAFFGCTWAVDRDLPVAYNAWAGAATYAPDADHWNALYLLHTAPVEETPPIETPPGPPATQPPATPTPQQSATPPPSEADGQISTGGTNNVAIGLGLGVGAAGAFVLAASGAFVIQRRKAAARKRKAARAAAAARSVQNAETNQSGDGGATAVTDEQGSAVATSVEGSQAEIQGT